MKQASSASEPLQPDFVKIVQDYGAVLMEATPEVVSDASNLPHSKQKIKDAIISSLPATNEDSLKQHLKTAYIQLADWQDGANYHGETVLDYEKNPIVFVLEHRYLRAL